MNRRKFLKKASIGATAVAIMPLLSFSDKAYLTTDRYEAYQKYVENGKSWHFKFLINSIIFDDFKNASAENKSIIFDGYNDPFLIKLHYKIISITQKTIADKNVNFVKCKIDQDKIVEDDLKFAKQNFGKEVTLEIIDKDHAILKNGTLKLDLKFYFVKPNENATCFLTTACVHHKGLSDDCKELTMLRSLRENVMLPNENYRSLIEEYKIVAPKMLANIEKADNKAEVLDYIYSQLVHPSVSLIENGKNEAAIEHYTQFVHKMKKHYL